MAARRVQAGQSIVHRMEKLMSANSHVPLTVSRRRVAMTLIFSAFVALLFATGDASAQIKREPATSRTPYQAYLAADCLEGSNFCRFVSDEVPAGGLLEIQRVACQGWHVSTSLPSFVVMAELRTGADAFVRRIDFLTTTYAPANGGSVWAISEQTLMFIPAAHKMRISLNSGTTGVGSYGCTISGYLTIS
jgi:hypothetical protein